MTSIVGIRFSWARWAPVLGAALLCLASCPIARAENTEGLDKVLLTGRQLAREADQSTEEGQRAAKTRDALSRFAEYFGSPHSHGSIATLDMLMLAVKESRYDLGRLKSEYGNIERAFKPVGIVDLDGDGRKEVILDIEGRTVSLGYTGVLVLAGQQHGWAKPEWVFLSLKDQHPLIPYAEWRFEDLDGDGRLEIVGIYPWATRTVKEGTTERGPEREEYTVAGVVRYSPQGMTLMRHWVPIEQVGLKGTEGPAVHK